MCKPPRGFTLTEIMIATALVALLCAMALPAVTAVVDEARINRAVNDIGATSIRIYKWRARNGSFPKTLAQAGIAMPTDPWGRPYVYEIASEPPPAGGKLARNTGHMNSDFDLYSLGADGRPAGLGAGDSSSLDDVLRARNGAFIGLASDY